MRARPYDWSIQAAMETVRDSMVNVEGRKVGAARNIPGLNNKKKPSSKIKKATQEQYNCKVVNREKKV